MKSRLLIRIIALLWGMGMFPATGAAQSWQWVAAPTSDANSFSEITAMAQDTDGTTVVAGNFTGTITLGAFTLAGSSVSNAFVGRLDRNGNWLQAVRAGSPGNSCTVSKLVVEQDGTAVVAGTFAGEQVSFGAISLTSAESFHNTGDLFVARLTRARIWSQAVQAGGASLDVVTALALDKQGNVVVGGEFRAVATFGTLTLTNVSFYTSDVFVARLSAAGIWLQAVRAGGPGHDYPTDMAVGADGTIIVAGSFYSADNLLGPTADFGAFHLTGSGQESDVFLARLSSDGQWTQAVRAGGSDLDIIADIALAADGTVVVAGSFFGPTITFGPQTLANSDKTGHYPDAFVARFAPDGTWTQAAQAGGPGLDGAKRVIINSDGSITVAGYFDAPNAAFGATTLTSAGDIDIFLATLSPNGTWTQARRAGSAGGDNVQGLLLADNHLLIAGGIGGPIARFDDITVPNSSAYYPKAYVASFGSAIPVSPPEAVVVPNIITPNGDGLNDAFRFSGAPGAHWSLRMYSRWGQLVYQNAHYQQDWDAPNLPAGHYYYHLEQQDGGAPLKGWLEVVR